MAGWVDNWNGPTGLVSAVGKGLFRTMLCEANYVADMVPVDIVINLMIAAAWRTATAKPDSLLIYNCCTGQQKPITWGQFVELAINKTRLHPLGEMVFIIVSIIFSLLQIAMLIWTFITIDLSLASVSQRDVCGTQPEYCE